MQVYIVARYIESECAPRCHKLPRHRCPPDHEWHSRHGCLPVVSGYPASVNVHGSRYCLVFRRYSNHSTWAALMPCIRSARVNWNGIRKALQNIIDSDEKMFGGLFYPATLRKYRMHPQWRWKACTGMRRADSENHVPLLDVVGEPIEGAR